MRSRQSKNTVKREAGLSLAVRLAWLRLKPWQRAAAAAAIGAWALAVCLFAYAYVRAAREVDARLSGEVFEHTSLVFSAPHTVTTGEAATPEQIVGRLRKALYDGGERSRVGRYEFRDGRLLVEPGALSFFNGQGGADPEGGAALNFRGGRITAIQSLDTGRSLASYRLEPEVITTLFDQSRTKRRLVGYRDIPPVLRKAVLAAEDRRFFFHHGINIFRVFAAAFKDLQADAPVQGASTLTMQLARSFFLTPRRTIRRKLEEMFLAVVMEQRLRKEQIFELYANSVYLGQRGSFSIEGFGAGADAYFNKDVRGLTLGESALLAGLIRGPNLYSPYRHPAAALRVRNYVLGEMQTDGYITAAQAAAARHTPLRVAPRNVEGNQAPFFVDMVKYRLLDQFSEEDLISQSYRIYTTLDPDLQRAASGAVRDGMAEVDRTLAKPRPRKGAAPPGPNEPQVALVVLDPHTGELRALVGGRDYASSQLNHALARRQPGSSFKPFVYAAALSTAIDGSPTVITPATLLPNEPTGFQFGAGVYEPRNYKNEYQPEVTVRQAITHSLNIATVHLAEMAGYGKVRALALQAGFNRGLEATPALALGAYVATPLEVANAYTIFANQGVYLGPKFIVAVRDDAGHTLWQSPQATRRVLDPRVSYLMVSLMESVIDNGTGAGVRTRGFRLPAAGKTGTSHDGWFAGFTSNLLAVTWVGYDDDRELGLSGSSSALPVWTDFMQRASQLPQYLGAQPFAEPEGIVSAQVSVPDLSGDGADPPQVQDEIFIAGTEPQQSLTIFERARQTLRRLFHLSAPPPAAGATARPPRATASQAPPPAPAPAANPPASTQGAPSDAAPAKAPKKAGRVKKLFSLFKHGRQKLPPPPPQENPASDR